MINGFFGDQDALLFEINLITSDGLELPVDAMLDRGFSSCLAINDQDLDALSWTYFDCKEEYLENFARVNHNLITTRKLWIN